MRTINIGILAHIDAGKTSITENLLFASGATIVRGSVDKGNTTTDSMDIEKRRGITVRASTTSIQWNDTKINIIDTPGHMDFLAEVERTFRMLDGAILVVSAKEGIQAQTRLLFNVLQQLEIPTILFVNKIDREGVNLNQLYLEIQNSLSKDIIFMQSVEGKELTSSCTIHYISEKNRETILEKDDLLLEKYLSDTQLSNLDYWNSMVRLVQAAKLHPIYHGSAMYGIGIEDLLNSITTFIETSLPQENALSAYVYKIEHNKKEQKRAYLKIIGGTLKSRKLYSLNGSDENLKIRGLKTFYSGDEIDVDEVFTNDIAIADHADNLMVGDYLGIMPNLFDKLNIPSPALKSSIHPAKVENRSKLISAMNVLSVEDPSLAFSINADNNELEVSLYGATQREVILTLLEERFSVDAYFEEVKTIYKERLKTKSEYTIHIEVPPNPYWASIGLIIEPLPIGAGLVMESEISLGYLNRSFQNAVFDGVKKACESGLYGWEVTDLKVTFSHGIYYSPVSTPADFRSLAPYVFRLALQQADVELLEPILDFKLQIPLAVNARAITDINKMQGEIYTITSDGDWTTILGNIPLDTSKEYSAEVSSYTQGLGVFVTRFSGYRPTNKKVSRSVELNEKDKLMYMFEKELG